MKVIAEFTPRHLEKALDLARHVATFGCFEFTVEGMIRLRVTDPAKVVHLDLQLIPDIYKIDQEFRFGVHLNMFYRMLKSLDNERTVEIEADESYMKINQSEHHHTLVAQLNDGVDGRLFVDPAQQAATEQGAIGVEVFGFYPFAGVKVHLYS